MYLSILPMRSSLIFLPVCFSIIFFNFTNIPRASPLYLMGYIQRCLDKLSIKEICFVVQAQSSTSPPSSREEFRSPLSIFLQRNLHKETTKDLHKTEVHNSNSQSSPSEDNKDHKQSLL